MTESLRDIRVAVLAGGLGTRLQGVLGDTPKVLAPVGGRPFLAHLLDRLAGFGAREVILCLGHLADRVEAYLTVDPPPDGLSVTIRTEPRPLGTAGAIAFVREDLVGGTVLVMNGDTFIGADLSAFAHAHRTAGAEVSLLCVEVDDAARYGRVDVGPGGGIRGFVEKAPGAGIINGGVYLMEPAFIERIVRTGAVSLERDVLEKMPPDTMFAHVARAPFIDIGTPESLAAAPTVLAGVASPRD